MQQFQRKLHAIVSDLIHGIELPENISVGEFADNVVESYVAELADQAIIIPITHKKAFVDEVKAEVLDITQKIIYGYSSIAEYQKTKFTDKT